MDKPAEPLTEREIRKVLRQKSLFRRQSPEQKRANLALALHERNCVTCRHRGVWSCEEHERLSRWLNQATARPPAAHGCHDGE